ncbi:MAG: F0F1 ATP synthase subunit delta [Ancrocorticia sp.]
MRSSSAGALARLRDTWEALLREHEGEELALAREIFAAANTVAAHRGLSRALTDPSRSDNDRAQLARDVFGSAVTEEVLDLLVGLARERWSKPRDLLDALNELGLFTAIVGAERQGELVLVEEQLYRTIRVLRRTRDLRVALSDRARSSVERIALAQRVFVGVTPTVRLLLGRAVELAPGEPLVRSLSHDIDAVAERAQHLVASVTVAAPLTRAQQERLTRILNVRYGREVSVHTKIDTSIIGGMRIRVGEDVIDGTLRTRIKEVRKTLGV